ncbi:Zinc finger protein [Yamadazyma tenuis]|uniref:Zinc finger protein n=1 Tax=Candida tenuis TaxID=2315449 RepID=UPI0027990E43|nr:Zinc finger protein [Yamadazyma tenuis]
MPFPSAASRMPSPVVGGFIQKNLLKLRLSVFQYVFKLDSLFPPIARKNIQDLSNKTRQALVSLPVACAVDDLEIYQNDKDQIYDLLENPTFYSGEYRVYETSNPQPSASSAQPSHYHTSHIKKEELELRYGSCLPEQPQQAYGTQPVYISQQSANELSDSHFHLNMVGGSDGYYFNDFKPHSANLDYYSSSTESYISPLDDELFKKKDFSVVSYHNPSIASVDFDLHSEITDASDRLDFMASISTPATSGVSTTMAAPDQKKRKNIPAKSATLKKPKIKVEEDELILADEAPGAAEDSEEEVYKFECSFCDARFKVKGYLTRHLKKHQSLKAFRCPFYNEDHQATDGSGKEWLENHIVKQQCSGTVLGSD